MTQKPKVREQYSVIGSDGGIETYSDAFVNVDDTMVEQGLAAEERIFEERNQIEASFLKLAFLLSDFDNRELYRSRGFATMREWCEDPSSDIGWRRALDLMRIAREAVPALMADESSASMNIAIEVVSAAKVTKVRMALPLLNDGMVDEFVDLLHRAPEMPAKELGKEVRRLRNGGEDKEMPAVFVAQLKRREKTSIYKVYLVDGLSRLHCGDLEIPNEHVDRWNQRFGRFLEVES